MKRSTYKAAAVAATTVALVAALAACAPAGNEPAAAPSGGGADAPAAAAPAETPEADSFGVVVADSWKDIYPNQYQTYKANESNSPEGKQDYLTEYPELVTMYAGYGFAKGYDEAASHAYTLQSVSETPRVNENTLANCLTCKTPQYTAMVNSEGDAAYQKPFAEVLMEMTEPISCYNCHENDPSKVVVTQRHFADALGADADAVSVSAETCGQCHNEYYFYPETKATSNPYVGLEAMTAEAMLDYYDAMDFKDWEHTETGAPMLKAQHPEFETIYGGAQSSMAKQGYSCADCHMAPATAEDGTEYSSHNLVNPTEDPAIMEKCEGCHADLSSQIVAWQKETTDREHELAAKLEAYIKELAAQRESLDADTLAEAQQVHRHAQFYWDFVMVENSEGAHNPGLAQDNLDKCEDELKAGYALLNMAY
ncbi:ammonia-forming cytochrome c nitrite reductase subunit c552 [Adlercreutzia sp. R25]|uniref:ammonia-forming cytochrome c nitrite reductase subunit c552 n=1 Tax=Adlercreutzia shanghongiae TaxID=3111773 RepID=UPI002DB8368A|nr:ammonia-forming cytochrome c nitrite reductase subunit c552 [Adlercreutzia sp. R25]MEC4273557.1 ammonia-forming cytochrome c nitrite reductase subunit c552 [Adlercreutzia sp. R25]